MSALETTATRWTEMGLVPDSAIRAGIRRLLAKRRDEIHAEDIATSSGALNEFVAAMNSSVIAPLPELANEQHYEVPAEFFNLVLGHHRKYSCCFWNEGVESLERAEIDALKITCQRAGLEDGMDILELGCGWGSLSLWIAKHYPNSSLTAVSNSASQRQYIERKAEQLGLRNIEVITCDMNDFEASSTYDRVVSLEMFEHMRNYKALFARIDRWLNPGGRFFMHIFCHRQSAYLFEDNGPGDWMSRHFFSGGMMPSADLPLRFQDDLRLHRHWAWDGRHYEKTSNAWLTNMDERKDLIMPVLIDTYGQEDAPKWFQRWRMFFMACAELFAYENGQEWFVSHYLFEKRERR